MEDVHAVSPSTGVSNVIGWEHFSRECPSVAHGTGKGGAKGAQKAKGEGKGGGKLGLFGGLFKGSCFV